MCCPFRCWWAGGKIGGMCVGRDKVLMGTKSGVSIKEGQRYKDVRKRIREILGVCCIWSVFN